MEQLNLNSTSDFIKAAFPDTILAESDGEKVEPLHENDRQVYR